MEKTEFNDLVLTKILQNLKKEKKGIIIMGDFNIDLLQYESDLQVSNFLDKMYSNSLIPHITGPTRVTEKSHTH